MAEALPGDTIVVERLDRLGPSVDETLVRTGQLVRAGSGAEAKQTLRSVWHRVEARWGCGLSRDSLIRVGHPASALRAKPSLPRRTSG